MQLNYRNIAISGGIAVGKGTLRENLRPYLEPLGWQFRSGGDILREYTKEHVNPLAKLADDDFHRALDAKTGELLDVGHLVVESWLAGFVARERTDTLRVFMHCSNEAIRVDRVMNRDKVSSTDAKNNIKDRESNNFAEWRRLYGDFDFWNPTYFQLSIDTYSSDAQETVHRVLEALGLPTAA